MYVKRDFFKIINSGRTDIYAQNKNMDKCRLAANALLSGPIK